jgi:hypothetical protein
VSELDDSIPSELRATRTQFDDVGHQDDELRIHPVTYQVWPAIHRETGEVMICFRPSIDDDGPAVVYAWNLEEAEKLATNIWIQIGGARSLQSPSPFDAPRENINDPD